MLESIESTRALHYCCKPPYTLGHSARIVVLVVVFEATTTGGGIGGGDDKVTRPCIPLPHSELIELLCAVGGGEGLSGGGSGEGGG